jgi:hypothetical protein
MAKQLSQITFEFGAEEPVPLPVKENEEGC